MGTEDSEDEVWGFQLFELATNRRGSKPFHPGSFTTPDIGSNIVFEIHDGYFYAVTSQITVDCEGQDPSSYYGGCRYPLSGSAEEAEFWRIWRRQQREGPIHDLWTDLTLRKDENSHNLVLSETRREWQDGFRKQKRTFYTEPLDLTAISNFNVSYREYVKLKQAAAGSLPTDKAEDEDFSVEILLSEVPDVLLPELSLPHRRSARHCQPEFYGSLVPGSSEFGLTSIKYRSYNYSNSAFLDIVVDSQSPTWCPGRRNCLRLRIGSRVLTSPVGTDGLLQRLDGQSDNEPRVDDESYGDSSIRLWPPLDAPAEIYDLLHNTSNLSKLNATSDERSLVYMATTDDPTCIAPIVLINFDPAIRFPGLKKVRFGEDIGSWSAKANEAALRRHELAHVRRDSPHEAATTAGESHSQRPWARMQKAEWQQRCYGFEFG
ncbi:hypothetical protein MMC13_005690 [Lambiella insularis]|nr:hypothetical protein [Lambiella insularis]